MAKVTVFYGFYGSGKSETSANYALRLAGQGEAVTIVDLDAVTPYFRVRDVRECLERAGVAVVAPKESLRHADLPALPGGVGTVLRHGAGEIVVDLGGDPTGARRAEGPGRLDRVEDPGCARTVAGEVLQETLGDPVARCPGTRAVLPKREGEDWTREWCSGKSSARGASFAWRYAPGGS